MPRISVVGIAGFKNSGKDTVAGILAMELKRPVQVAHYAYPLKQCLSLMLGIPIEWFYDRELKESVYPGLGITPRQAMTDFHDALVPKFGPGVFSRYVQREYSNLPKGALLLIPDVRFPGVETDWIYANHGAVLHVTRPGAGPGGHVSEKGVPVMPGDVVIENSSSLEALRERVIEAAITLGL